MNESQFTEMMKSVGVSEVYVTPETCKMLQIEKAIAYLYGEFLNQLEEVMGEELYQKEEEAFIEPMSNLSKKMWEVIVDIMRANNGDVLEIEI